MKSFLYCAVFVFILYILLINGIANAQSVNIISHLDNTIYEISNRGDTLSNGSGQHFYVGKPQYDNYARRGLLAFDIDGNIPENAVITRAFLTLHMSRTRNGARSMSIHRVLSDWGEGASLGSGEGSEGGGDLSEAGDASWVHTFYPDSYWLNSGGDFSVAASDTQLVNDEDYYTWGSTDAMAADVQYWLDSGENYGWIVIGREDTVLTSKRFDTHENSTPDYRPLLTVEYNTPPEILPISDKSFKEDDSLVIEISELLSYVSDSGTADSLLDFIVYGGDYIDVYVNLTHIIFKAPENWFGDDTFTIQVSDGQLSTSAHLNIHVLPLNDAPYLLAELPDSVVLDTAYTIPLWEHFADVETPNSMLIWQFGWNNQAIALNINAITGELTLTRTGVFSGSSILSVSAIDDSGAVATDSMLIIVEEPSALENEISTSPRVFKLFQNYPNPFNPHTRIKFALPNAEYVTLEVYNALGQKIITLVDKPMTAGFHQAKLQMQDLSSGIYYYRIKAGDFLDVKKMILLK